MSYCSKILKIDLSSGDMEIIVPDEKFYRTYFGGRAFIGHYLCKNVTGNIDPFDPANPLIFSAGLLTGVPLAGSGRHSVGAISPLTGGFGNSEAGGFWGTELKKAGFDAIIIQGLSDKPVYLFIEDEKALLIDASHLWGKSTRQVDRILREELGEKIRIAQCGPAGEKLVRFACIVHDLRHFAGRNGLGAIMGSKNLRAVVLKSTGKVSIYDRAKLISFNRELSSQILARSGFLKTLGTAGVVDSLNLLGGLPTQNFQSGVFNKFEDINGETMQESYLVGRESCYACPIRCKRVVKVIEPYIVDSDSGGPEYETIGAFGSACGISDLAAICRANEVCTDYGLDTISAGMVIAFAMESFGRGVLIPEDNGGQQVQFGDSEAMLELLFKIGERSGLGDLLAEGSSRASQKIGLGSEKWALHVKGQEIPMHEPRLKNALGLGYAVSPTGADHVHNLHDTAFVSSTGSMAEFGFLEPLLPQTLDQRKVAIFKYFSNWRHFIDSAVICIFINWTPLEMSNIVKHVTGWNSTAVELLRVGERAANLARCFNIICGFNSNDDILPQRFSMPFSEGPLEGKAISPYLLSQAVNNYYRLMGWSENGIPTSDKLVELGLGWLVEKMNSH